MSFLDNSPEQDEFLPTGNERTGYYHQALRAIQSADPDGGEREPNEHDYAAHKSWAIGLYGQAAWDRYVAGGWDSPDSYA